MRKKEMSSTSDKLDSNRKTPTSNYQLATVRGGRGDEPLGIFGRFGW